MNWPDGERNERAMPLSQQSFISPGLAPMYPNVTIASRLMAGMRNISRWLRDITTF